MKGKRVIICPSCQEEKEHYGKGLCRKCYGRLYADPKYRKQHGEQIRSYQRKYFHEHREEFANRMKTYRDRIRLEMIEAYGGRCICCGEIEPAFLTIDHIHGSDKKHGQNGRSGGSLLGELKRQGWPKEGYQLLCWNCNTAKYRVGQCPHQNS